jgi:hypothetical protein
MSIAARIPKWRKKNARDTHQILDLISQVGSAYWQMDGRTRYQTKEDLLKLAAEYAEQMLVRKPNRFERRQKRALIFWFCEFWADFPAQLPTNPAPSEYPADVDEPDVPFDNWPVPADFWDRDFDPEDFPA